MLMKVLTENEHTRLKDIQDSQKSFFGKESSVSALHHFLTYVKL